MKPKAKLLLIDSAGKFSGLTLLEIIFAMAMVALAALALVTLFAGGLKLVRQSDDVTRATEVARTCMENIKLLNSESVPQNSEFDGRIPTDVDKSGFPPEPYPALDIDGKLYVVVVRTVPKGNSLKAVQVEVWWDSDSHLKIDSALMP